MTRRTFLSLTAVPLLPAAAPLLPAAPGRRTSMGLTSDSFQSIRFSSPQKLLEVDRLMELAAKVGAAGAHGGMTSVDFDWAKKTRRMKEELGMYLEIQTFLPKDDPAVFEHAVRVAKEAGATSLRVVCLLGRRYEMFDKLADWNAAVDGFHRQIRAAVPIVEKYKMPLGIENSQGLAGGSAGGADEAAQQRVSGSVPGYGQQHLRAGRPYGDDREAGSLHV